MTKPSISDAEILGRAGTGDDRISLQDWLELHYAELLQIGRTKGLNWPRLAADLTAKGMLTHRGQAISKKAVKQAWFRLKKQTEAEPPAVAPAETTPKPRPPSRTDPNWQPAFLTTEIEQSPSLGLPVAPRPPTIVEEAPDGPRRTVADMTPEESVQKVLREMDRRANRKIGIR